MYFVRLYFASFFFFDMCMIFTEQEYKIVGLAVPICLILIRDNQDNHGSHVYLPNIQWYL